MAAHPKQRYISTSFWDDPWVASLEPTEKLLFLYLMTNPLTNIAGIYEITIRRIVFDTGMKEEIIKGILARFEEQRKVFYRENHIIICSWPRHQKWDERSKIKLGIEMVLRQLPIPLHRVIDTECIPYAYPINKVSISYTYLRNYSDSDSEFDSEADSKTDTDLVDDPVENHDPADDSADAAAAVMDNLRAVGLFFSSSAADKVTKALIDHDVGPDFIPFAEQRIRKRPEIKNPPGFLKNMLADLDAYTDWIVAYRAYVSKQTSARASPPTRCTRCNQTIRTIGDEDYCWCVGCKLVFEYDPDFDAWLEAPESDLGKVDRGIVIGKRPVETVS